MTTSTETRPAQLQEVEKGIARDRIKIALLPLYLELYDQTTPEARQEHEKFLQQIKSALEGRNLEVVMLPVSRRRQEFDTAVKTAERSGACALVTFHLAYSPSLESIPALSKTNLPIVVLDTTPDIEFSPEADPGRIMYNHGIHGVQDMCNLLIRHNKFFTLEAGHIESSDVVDRLFPHIRAAQAAYNMQNARTGLIGTPFKGMGDFSVSHAVLKDKMGVTVIPVSPTDIATLVPAPDDPDVVTEMESDRTRFDASQVSEDLHRLSVQSGLAVRKWIERESLSGFSVNFQEITRKNKIPAMPFLEISKLLSRGIGFGGEGDVLTASLVGALAQVYGNVSFTEMFCPDWKNNTIFLSHMGEINLDLAAQKPVLIEKPWPFTDTEKPVIAAAAFKGGQAAIVDLAPGPSDTFTLIIAPGEMVSEGSRSNFSHLIRGWFRPDLPIHQFLKEYSLCGGTHHKALVYGNRKAELETFGKIMGWKTVVIE